MRRYAKLLAVYVLGAALGISCYFIGKRSSDKYWEHTKIVMFPAGMNCWECHSRLDVSSKEPRECK